MFKHTLPEKFTFIGTNPNGTIYTAQRLSSGYNITWESGSFVYEFESVEDFVSNGSWKILTQESSSTNGVDAAGNPLNFTDDMWKVGMRYVTNNGKVHIVMPNHQDSKTYGDHEFAGISVNGFTECVIEKYLFDINWMIVQVYEAPSLNIDLLNHSKTGKLIWRRENQRVREIKKEIAVLNEELANLECINRILCQL